MDNNFGTLLGCIQSQEELADILHSGLQSVTTLVQARTRRALIFLACERGAGRPAIVLSGCCTMRAEEPRVTLSQPPQDILDLEVMERGTFTLHPEPMHVRRTVNSVVRRVELGNGAPAAGGLGHRSGAAATAAPWPTEGTSSSRLTVTFEVRPRACRAAARGVGKRRQLRVSECETSFRSEVLLSCDRGGERRCLIHRISQR